jgi:hypothetical protein
MPIAIPNLDDRNYDQLLSETMGLITRYFPSYSGIGPSDPAMALNELFCYLFEIAVYQMNRITPESRQNFAALLGIPKIYGQPPEEALGLALAALSRIERAVSADDIELIIKRATQDPAYAGPVTRVCVLPGDPVKVFVAQQDAKGELMPPQKEELQRIYRHLRAHSPLAARLLLLPIPILSFDVYAEIARRQDSTIPDKTLTTEIKNRLGVFFHHLKGGDAGEGWEFGRPVSRSEIYGLIEGIAGVDHINSLLIKESKDKNYGASELHPAKGGLVKFGKLDATVMSS